MNARTPRRATARTSRRATGRGIAGGTPVHRLIRRLLPAPRGEYANDGFPLRHPPTRPAPPAAPRPGDVPAPGPGPGWEDEGPKPSST
ncbi:hypothetical protein RM780_18305 [Streptomyces sp. DSM 44917]|uniref:Uncharacterized protein n=1 Tax=Streptomyces boetiae TaxID=3075541 RepID=A0ABU2LBE2_9ACTN|nr:hypothetical protein [Streptomyces sp. DSM 44917]MDT0308898.1 hypothetical protein [Streptomyces sp. DSM 44917]